MGLHGIGLKFPASTSGVPWSNQDDFFRISEIQTSMLVITSRRFISCPFDSVSVRLNSAFLHDAIALAEHDDAGLPVLDLMFGDVGEAHSALW